MMLVIIVIIVIVIVFVFLFFFELLFERSLRRGLGSLMVQP